MKRVMYCLIVVTLVASLIVTACAPKPTPEHEEVSIDIYGGWLGTPPYEIGIALSEMLYEHPWLRATPLESLGSAGAVHTVEALPPERRNNALIATFGHLDLVLAWQGLPPYEREFTDLKIVAGVHEVCFGLYSYDPDIRTYEDLIGKRVANWMRGDAPEILTTALLRDGWDILDQVTGSHHAPPTYKDILITGVVDVIPVSLAITREPGKFAVPAFNLDVMGVKQTYWVDISQEAIDRMNQANPWVTWRVVVPKGGAIENHPLEDAAMFGFKTILVAFDTVPEEIVYEMVKFLDENGAEYTRRMHDAPMDTAFMAKVPGTTEEHFHPGAVRYFKEMGVKIGE